MVSALQPTNPPIELQNAVLQAVQALSELAIQLSTNHPDRKQPQQQSMQGPDKPSDQIEADGASEESSGLSSIWEELSVVELRSLLRSYPIDRSSLPAPIERLRRDELTEALRQIQALTA